MDTSTHGLIAIAVSQAGLRQRWGVPATVATVLGATLPDLDIMLGFIDPLYSMLYHRSATHSLVMLPVTAAVCAAPAFLYGKRRKLKFPDEPNAHFGPLWFCAAIGVFLQCIPDFLTNYGTQLFWPFSNYRYALDWIFIIDLTYTGIAIITFILAGQARRRTSPVFYLPKWLVTKDTHDSDYWRRDKSGLARRGGTGLRVGQVGVAVLIAYNIACAFAHNSAENVLNDYLRRHEIDTVRTSAYPRPFTLMNWGLMYTSNEDSGPATYYAEYELGEPLPERWRRIPHPADKTSRELTSIAHNLEAVRAFYWFADFPQVDIKRAPDGGWNMTYFDLRFYMHEPWEPRQLVTDGRSVHGFMVMLTPDQAVRGVRFLR